MGMKYFRILLFSPLFLLSLSCSNWKGNIQVISVEKFDEGIQAPRIPIAPIALPSELPQPDRVSRFYEIAMDHRTVFPPLKMVFVVDNSYTMKKAHENLAQSFEKMFAGSNAQNLTPFDTTVYLINTAQKNVDPNGVMASKIPELDLIKITNGTYSEANLALDRADSLSGKVSGDIIGYSKVNKLSGPSMDQLYTSFFEFLPAPVLSISNENGRIGASAGLHKSADEPASELVGSFVEKLAIMSPLRSLGNYQVSVGTSASGEPTTIMSGEFNPILDKESGLCALSRMLRNSESYFKAGDLASWVIVSDEEDNDPLGIHCLQSQKSWNEVVVNKKSYTPFTCQIQKYTTTGSISFSTTAAGIASKCAAIYYTGYRAKLFGNAYTTTASYFIKNTKYRTRFVTQGSTAVTRKIWSFTTNINYTTKNPDQQTCISNDGVIESCTTNPSTFAQHSFIVSGTFPLTVMINGNSINNCKQRVLDYDHSAYIDANHLPICTVGSSSTDVIDHYSLNDPQITVATITLSQATMVSGVADCRNFISSRTNLKLNEPLNTSNVECAPVFTYTSAFKTIDGKLSDMCPGSTVSSATAFLRTKGSIAVTNYNYDVTDAAHQPSCSGGTSPLRQFGSELTVSNLALASLPSFNPSVISEGTYSIGGIITGIDAIANVIKANAFLSVDLTSASFQFTKVSINYIRGVSSSLVSGLVGNSNCTTAVLEPLFVSRPLGAVISGATFTAAIPSVTTTTSRLIQITANSPSTLTCDTNCSGVQKADGSGAYCSGNFRLRDYQNGLAGALSSSCQISQLVTTSTINITNAEATSSRFYSCSSVPGSTLVAGETEDRVVSTNILEHLNNELVSGEQFNELEINQLENGLLVPKRDLTQYIIDRSAEVFGERNKPLISFFKKINLDENQKVNYEDLVQKLGGNVEDLNSNDYSSALEKLSDVINEKIARSVVIEDLVIDEVVLHVWRKGADGNYSEIISPEMWSQSGKTIVFSPDFKLSATDTFKFEYKSQSEN